METSIGILKKPSDLNTLYSKFRRELDPILDDLDFRLINYGYQPKSSFADVPVNPQGSLRRDDRLSSAALVSSAPA